MKEVYEFIHDIYLIQDSFVRFFFNKSAYQIGKIDDQDRNSYGDILEISGRENEFKNEFYPLIEKYIGTNKDDLIRGLMYQIEHALLATDAQGREFLMKRISRELNKTAYIGTWGIDIMSGIDFIEDGGLFFFLYDEVAEEGYAPPECLKTVKRYIDAISEMTNEFYRFYEDFVILCEDFGTDIRERAKEWGFDKLSDLPIITDKERNVELIEVTKKNNEFSIQRKRSAILYLVTELSGGLVYGGCGDIPATEIWRFVHFLTGIGTKNDDINNTSIASSFKRDNRSEKAKKRDDEFIAEYFEKIGLNKLAIKVRNGELRNIL